MPITDKFGWTVPTVGANKNAWGQMLNEMFDNMDQAVQRVTTIGETAPTSPSEGDLWVDTTGGGKVLKVYQGSSWVTISAGSGANELLELTDVGDSTPTDGNILAADGTDFDSKTPDSAGIVAKTGDQTIAGKKTFSTFPETPGSAPTTDYQTANKKYVDDNAGSFDQYTGSKNNMVQDETITINHPSETSYDVRMVTFVREVLGDESNWSTLDFDIADEASYLQGDVKGTAVNFQVDTADTSGHFEDSGNYPVTIGPSQTEDRIVEGVRFKLVDDDTVYEISSITDDGEADNEVVFTEQDGDTTTKATGTYAVEWIYGTEFSDGIVQLNAAGAGATETWSMALDADSATDVADYSHRQVILASAISTSGSQIRVTFEAHSTDNTIVDNVSIVERSASTANGTTTPTELLFSGGSGFSISAGATITSDWLDFSLDETKDYLVILDFSSATNRRRVKTSGGLLYYKVSTDSYDQQDVTGFSEAPTVTVSIKKMEIRSTAYPVDQFYIIVTTDSNQADCTDWEDINSATITDTPNGETACYAFSFDGRTTWGIFDDTAGDVGWRPIARDNSGTWQLNSNTTPGANDITWTNAATSGENTQESSLAQALQVAANQMDSTAVNAISDANWENTDGAMNGWSTDATSVNVAIGLKTSSASETPTVDQVTLAYQAPTKWEPIIPNDDWAIEYYDTRTKLIKVGSGTESIVKGMVRIPK